MGKSDLPLLSKAVSPRGKCIGNFFCRLATTSYTLYFCSPDQAQHFGVTIDCIKSIGTFPRPPFLTQFKLFFDKKGASNKRVIFFLKARNANIKKVGFRVFFLKDESEE